MSTIPQIRKALVLPRVKYYETHLSIINCLLPVKMTPMQIKVISSFMALEGHIAIYRFGPSAKKLIRTILKISPAGLSNYLTALQEKGFIIEQDGIRTIKPLLIPNEDAQEYLIRLTNNKQTENEESTNPN